MSDPQAQMPGHDYDGITELDNTLPRWWLYLFYLTTIFAGIYLVYYHVLKVEPLSAGQYEQEIAAAARKPAPAAAAADAPAPVVGAAPAPALPSAPLTDPAVLAKGKGLFLANCMVCHGPEGGGLIGPNLCDTSFIHGPTFADEIHTIMEGVPAKGMITWKNIMKPDDILTVASYVWTLRGTSPANPKPPEGVQATP